MREDLLELCTDEALCTALPPGGGIVRSQTIEEVS